MDRLQRRMITTVCGEMIDPFKRNMNIDLKTLRKHLEECMVTLDEHRGRHLTYQQQLDLINVTILRQLKNTDNEKELLGRELQRMQ